MTQEGAVLTNDDWPSHTEELTRKTAQTIDRWSKAYNAGVITRREFFILIRGINDVTSGLINREMSDVIADIHKDLRS